MQAQSVASAFILQSITFLLTIKFYYAIIYDVKIFERYNIMRKTVKILIAFLAFALCFASVAMLSSAEDSGPALFSITDSEGTVTNYYALSDFKSAAQSMESGSTLTLLSDLTFEDGMSVLFNVGSEEDGVKTINEYFVDMNGHDVYVKKKDAALFRIGAYSTLHVYSSKPGAEFFGKDCKDTKKNYKGSAFLSAGGTDSTLYFGDHGEYSGDNISLYTCCVIDLNDGENAKAYINGGLHIKNIGDYTGFFCVRGRGYMEINDAIIITTIKSPPSFNLAHPTHEGEVVCNNTLFVGIGASAAFTNISRNYTITYNNCHFTGMTFTGSTASVDEVLDENGNVLSSTKVYGKAIISEDCTFGEIPENLPEFVVLPENVEFLRVNRDWKGTLYYCDFGTDISNIDFEVRKYEANYPGRYAVSTTDKKVQVIWSYNDQMSEEYWLSGETPTHSFSNIRDSEAVKYHIEGYGPVTSDTIFSIEPMRDFDIYANLTVYSQINLNLYIPADAMESITAITLTGGVEVDLTKLTTIKHGGVDYYKVEIKNISLSSAAKNYTVNFTALDGANKKCTLSFTFSVLDYAQIVMDSDVLASKKEFVALTVLRIEKAYKKLGLQVPASVTDFIDEHCLPTRTEE